MQNEKSAPAAVQSKKRLKQMQIGQTRPEAVVTYCERSCLFKRKRRKSAFFCYALF